MNNIDSRFSAIFSYVSTGAVAADIGADHGKLAVMLIKNNRASHVFATDINEKPLAKTVAAIQRHGLGEHITPILADGLAGMEHLPLTDIIIAGMGGSNIASIIKKSVFMRRGINFILQPMTRAEELRSFLYTNNFDIISETLVEDNNRIYPIIKTIFSGENFLCTPADIALGRKNIENRFENYPLFHKYALRKLNIAKKRRLGRSKVSLDTASDDVLIKMIEEILQV